MYTPDGWKFDPSEWPEGLDEFANGAETKVDVDCAQMRDHWNDTAGAMDEVILEREDNDPEGFFPGFGSPIALVAVLTSAILLRRRRA